MGIAGTKDPRLLCQPLAWLHLAGGFLSPEVVEQILAVAGLLSPALGCPLQDFSETPIFTDTAVFRVAPWIMTPSTQPPLEVYVCR